jgi:hypothetical protein
MNLDDIITRLEAQSGLSKQASEDTEKDEKTDEEKAKSFFGKAEKEVDKAEKKNGEEEKKDEECKDEEEAHEKGASFAKEIMAKFAAQTQSVTKEDTMNKQAAAAGAALADAILQKIANAGDETTDNGIKPGLVPNKGQVDNAQMVAEDDAKIQPTPGTDGMHDGGSINQIFDAIVADASQGATSFNQVHIPGVAAKDGDATRMATPHQEGMEAGDEQEKAAAVSALVSQGFDFDEAVGMVKAAAEEIDREETSQVKQAALANLIERGVDFDSAVALVKQASFGDMAKSVAGMAGNTAKGLAAKPGSKLVGAAAGGAAAGAMAARVGQEKKAAFNALLSHGVDFATAATLVNQKSQELYGV